MSWTTLVLVTVLFSVICGNRLMDSRLLRYSAATEPFKALLEDSELRKTWSKLKSNMNSESDVTFLDSLLPGPYNKPNSQLEIRNRNCKNDNFMDFLDRDRNHDNYPGGGEEVITGGGGGGGSGGGGGGGDGDLVPRLNDLQWYGNSKPYEDDESSTGVGINNERIWLNSLLSVLPTSNYKDFYADLVMNSAKGVVRKRNGNSIGPPLGSAQARGCDCKVKNDLVDLGQQHFPRYLLNAICPTGHDGRGNDIAPKCWSGSMCRPLEYKVKVLTFRTLSDAIQKDATLAWLPDDLRPRWKFTTVTVTAGCFCS